MAKHKDKDFLEEEEIEEQVEQEVEEIEDNSWEIDEDKLEEELNPEPEDESCMDKLLKTQADFQNFKSRTQREKSEMIFFLKQDILKKVLPVLDDLERIINSTLDENKNTPIYEWVVALYKKVSSDLEKMWVKAFDSLWKESNPDRHEVMTTLPGKKEGVICDEFEKWYELDGKVLRHAKVVVWAWE